MWVPVALGPGRGRGRGGGFFSRRMAKTALPHRLGGDRGQRPAGHLPARPRHRPEAGRLVATPATTWRWGRRCWRRCWSPWSAGWACWPRSCGGSSERRPGHYEREQSDRSPRFPGFDVLGQASALGPGHPGVVAAPARAAVRHPVLHPGRGRPCARRAAATCSPGSRTTRAIPVAGDDRRPAGRGRDRRLALRRHARGRPGLAGHARLPRRGRRARCGLRVRRAPRSRSSWPSSRPCRTWSPATGTA